MSTKTTDRKGTTGKKKLPVVTVAEAEEAARLAGLPLEATLALTDVAGAVKEGLMAFVSSTGLAVAKDTSHQSSLPSSREARASSVPRSFGRSMVTGPVVVLIVVGQWPLRLLSRVRSPCAAVGMSSCHRGERCRRRSPRGPRAADSARGDDVQVGAEPVGVPRTPEDHRWHHCDRG